MSFLLLFPKEAGSKTPGRICPQCFCSWSSMSGVPGFSFVVFSEISLLGRKKSPGGNKRNWELGKKEKLYKPENDVQMSYFEAAGLWNRHSSVLLFASALIFPLLEAVLRDNLPQNSSLSRQSCLPPFWEEKQSVALTQRPPQPQYHAWPVAQEIEWRHIKCWPFNNIDTALAGLLYYFLTSN